MRRHLRWALAGLIWTPLLGCSDIFGPDLPDGAIPLAPLPATYEGWWSIVTSCSGLPADLSDVDWWVLPGQRVLPGDEPAVGRYFSGGHRILLADGRELDGFLVRHEMLHAVLAEHGVSGHPKSFFERHCGGVVSCSGRCADEVAGPSDGQSNAFPIQTEDVEVSARMVPVSYSSSAGLQGCGTIVVDLRNVGGRSVVMDLGDLIAFRWIVEGVAFGSGGGPVPPNAEMLLRPGDVRSYAYDCPERIRHLEPGDYLVSGRWRTALGEASGFTVTP